MSWVSWVSWGELGELGELSEFCDLGEICVSQRSQVSWMALWMCSLSFFAFVIIFVFVITFVFQIDFVIVFFWSGQVFSSLWSNVPTVTSL